MSFQLPPLPPTQPDWGSFQVWWQQIAKILEDQEARQDQVDTDLAAAIADIAAAQAAAAAASAAASAAQSTANTVKRDDSIADSWTVPGTTLTASDAGSDATIAIAAHSRKYNDGNSVSISATSLTGKAYSTKYYVYYDDATRSDTTPNFVATTNAATAVANSATGRHFVGTVTTPASGGGSTSGGINPPSGGGGIERPDIF